MAASTIKSGTDLISSLTQHLNTLNLTIPPSNSKPLEDLLSLTSLTTSLLRILDTNIQEYSSPSVPEAGVPVFVKLRLLCEDLESVFGEVRVAVDGLNDNGDVDAEKLGVLKAKLGVQRERLGCLIDGMNYKGLKELERGDTMTTEQREELKVLAKTLPVIVEGLGRLQADYQPRIQGMMGTVDEDAKTIVAEVEKKDDADLKIEKPTTITNTSNTDSASSPTNDRIYETWLLRRHEPSRDLSKSHNFLGLPIWKTYTHKHPTFYIKPLASTTSQISLYISRSSPKDSKKQILAMPDRAQWEIQKLCETRDNACSGEGVSRSWNVVAFESRPRRKIYGEKTGMWWRKGKGGLLEWVLVLRGETLDQEKRVMVGKNEDSWKARAEKEVTSDGVKGVKGVVKKGLINGDEAEKKIDELVKDFLEVKIEDQEA